MDLFRGLLSRVTSVDEAKSYGLHSLRVSGWNGARRGPAGEELAIAQGGWHSGSQTRYDRFGAQEICDLPRHVLEGADAALPTTSRIVPAPPPSPSPRPRPSRSAASSVGVGAPLPAVRRRERQPAPPRVRPSETRVSIEELDRIVTEKDRPSTRRPPVERVRAAV